VTLRFRELEFSRVHSGLGVRLIDDHTQAAPFGWKKISLDIDDGGTWRELDPDLVRRATTASGIVWFPWLERHRDAYGLSPRKYRVRVAAEFSTPLYLYDREGIEVFVDPYDDTTPPASSPAPIDIVLVPTASYPFAPAVPVLRGAIEDIFGERIPNTLVSWIDPTTPPPTPPLVVDQVLSDADGEFNLPMRRAPTGVSIDIYARRPPPPIPGKNRKVPVMLPADLSTFHTIQIL
jgi:hypothetical protein